MTYRFVACQSFAGGFDLGMVQSGFELVHKVEQRGGFGLPNVLANRHLIGDNWTHQAGDPADWRVPRDVNVIAANPPCSGFSVLTAKELRGTESKINSCMWVLVEYAARVRPAIVIMESVRPAFTNGRSLMVRLRAELERASGLRYDLHHVMHDALELGGPARRPRYFWVASRVPFRVDYPAMRSPLLRDVWGDLREHALTWERQPYRRPASWWSDHVRRDDGFDGHVWRNGTATRRALDLMTLLETDGDGWRPGWAIGRAAKYAYTELGQLPDSWTHMIPKLLTKNFELGYSTIVRWDADRPCRVVTGTMEHVMHPWESRTITHREAARALGFPDDWRIKPLRAVSGTRATWGKGITVHCGRWIGGLARAALDGAPRGEVGREIGDREWFHAPEKNLVTMRRHLSQHLVS